MAAWNKFYVFVQDLANKQHDLKTGTSDVYKAYLTNSAPSQSNTVYNTPADLSTANGYTAGGTTIGTITGSQSSGVFSFSGGTNPSWTASGGSIGPFQYVVFYNSSNASKPLIGWADYGSAITVTNGNSFTATLPSPLFTIT